ncbi:MAG: alpha/beta fold hydrolase [Solirubrobacterales bacterium]
MLLAGQWTIRHRTSLLVAGWSPPSAAPRQAGALAARVHGDSGEQLVVLLHGLLASGGYFGSTFECLSDHNAVVIPDLLGFGQSMDERRASFSLDDHLDALDGMLDDLDLAARPRLLVGHSLGAVLALHWADRSPELVRGVLALSAPLHRSSEQAVQAIAGMGYLERLFALRTPVSRTACAWMCAHRDLASWLLTAASPRLPVPVSRQAVAHTWPSYLGALEDVIIGQGHPEVAQSVAEADIPVVLAAAERDPVVSWPIYRALADTPGISLAAAYGDEHQLPLAAPRWCLQRLSEIDHRQAL